MVLPSIELQESISPRRLHLILLPSEACNFRCIYCYETFRLGRMEPEVVEGIKRLLSRRAPTLERLIVSWFGGEPLLAADIMENVLRHVAGLRASNPAMAFASDATTNASLLTAPRLESLASLGVTDYQVTFDGPRRWHDRKRVRPGGASTYGRIWANLLACRASGSAFQIMVRLHVDQENAASIGEFLDEYEREFGGDPRFILYIRGLSKLGGRNDSTLPILEGDARGRTIDELRRLAADRGIRQADVGPGAAVCYAAKGNSFVIRADGRVNKCTVALDDPSNQVGTIREDGTLQLRSERIRPWMRGFDTGDRSVLACPMKGLANNAAEVAPTSAPRTRTGGAPSRSPAWPLAVTGGGAR